ncbi:MAG: potassium transporter TrkG [Coriobacteriales bacterium]|jgi:trk system potassium uptake protein TrkH
MWTRLRIEDVRSIVHYLGLLVVIVGVLMVVPLVVALLSREWNPAIWFVLSLGVTTSVGLAMSIVRPTEMGLTRKQATILTGLAWLVVAVFCAIPSYLSGNYLSYFDALFNAASSLTGTGMSLMNSFRPIPTSLSVWNSMMVIIGAQGIVLVAMGLGTISNLSGTGTLFSAEGHSDKIGPQVADTSRFVGIFMGIFILVGTVACTLILIVSDGFTPGFALLHGFTCAANAVATGGTTIMPTGVDYYRSTELNLVLSLLELTGTFSFALYFYMARKGPREFLRDIETRVILCWMAVVTVVLSIAFAGDGRFGSLEIFFDKGLFNLISAVTGTGYMTFTSSQISSVASSAVVFTLILGMCMGGATSSTAGGFKAIRMGLVVRSVVSEVRRTLMPAHAREVDRFYHFGEQELTPEMSRNVMLVIILYLISFAIGAVLGVAYGYDAVSAVLESVSCTANCGISSGIVTPGMPMGLKVCYFIQMLAGRLEFITLLTTLASIGSSVGYAVESSRLRRSIVGHVPVEIKRAWHGQRSGEGARTLRQGHGRADAAGERVHAPARGRRAGSPGAAADRRQCARGGIGFSGRTRGGGDDRR